ncbi:hypothetical protein [Marinobacter sp. LV10MA510-1]
MNFLASPPLVVAYALAGSLHVNLLHDPLGEDSDGKPVYLHDIWPSSQTIEDTIAANLHAGMFTDGYSDLYAGDERWQGMDIAEGDTFQWQPDSTYVRKPPFFDGMERDPAPLIDIIGAHLAPDTEGGFTRDFTRADAPVTTIYEAAESYAAAKTPLVILAGKEYGSGSSRDWAAKGTALLGVRAVIAESYERIHRSNLIGMGVLPLQFLDGQNAETLGLTGEETFAIKGLASAETPAHELRVSATDSQGQTRTFDAIVRIDTPAEADYYRHGGILPYVLRQLLEPGEASR